MRECDCLMQWTVTVFPAAYMQAQSPILLAGSHTPAERLREVWSEEQVWPWCWCRALGVAAAALGAIPRATGASSAVLPGSGRQETQEERSRQQSVTPAVPVPVRGAGHTPLLSPAPVRRWRTWPQRWTVAAPYVWTAGMTPATCCHASTSSVFGVSSGGPRASLSAPCARGLSPPSCTQCGRMTSLKKSPSQRLQRHWTSATQLPLAPSTPQDPNHRPRARCLGLLWAASIPPPGPSSSACTRRSSSPCCPGCAVSWSSCWGLTPGQRLKRSTSSSPACASLA
nr:uncharacterized protein LOC106040418 [Anser cygnoides]XP_047936530.1 uncharacterized protein LOC106040418 [Anser cygnoides]